MVKDGKYQICNRCVMDTFDEFITFDQRGYCNHCEEFSAKDAAVYFRRRRRGKTLGRVSGEY